jgi:N-acylglucosamine 2-epimerase
MLEHCPNAEQTRRVLEIMEGSLEFGWDREYGGLLYFVDNEGRPGLTLESDMKLWWPHTEALYSLVLAYLRTGDEKWLRWLERVDEYSFRVFADPGLGEWFGYCDRAGRVTIDAKGGNYKGCFHVPRALLLSLAAIERSSRA